MISAYPQLFFNQKGLMSSCQYGFRQHCSLSDMLGSASRLWFSMLGKHRHILLIWVKISKIGDRVGHGRSIGKTSHVPIDTGFSLSSLLFCLLTIFHPINLAKSIPSGAMPPSTIPFLSTVCSIHLSALIATTISSLYG